MRNIKYILAFIITFSCFFVNAQTPFPKGIAIKNATEVTTADSIAVMGARGVIKKYILAENLGISIGSGQNNKPVFQNYIIDFSNINTIDESLTNAINFGTQFTVQPDEILFIKVRNAQLESQFAGLIQFNPTKIYVVRGLGKGTYGTGGDIIVTKTNLVQIGSIVGSILIANQDENTQFIELGNVGATPILTAFNSHLFSGIENPVQAQDEGYVLVNVVINNTPLQYLFVGEGGSYGSSGNKVAVQEDLILLTDTPIGGGVESVTGGSVDNTDPLNPIVNPTKWNEIEGDQKDVNLIGFTDGSPFEFKDDGFIYSGSNLLRNMDSDNKNTIVGNLYSNSSHLKVLVSHDLGVTWNNSATSAGTSILKGSSNGVWIRVNNGNQNIKRSTDNGDSFSDVVGTSGVYNVIKTDDNGTWIVLGSSITDYKLSTDDGATWTDKTLLDGRSGNLTPIGPETWIYSSATKVYRSTDNTNTWVELSNVSLLGGINASFNSSGVVMAVKSNSNVYLSNDYGQTFTTVPLDAGQNYYSVSYRAGSWLLLGSIENQLPNGKFKMAKVSNDDGATWRDVLSDIKFGTYGSFRTNKGWIIPYDNSKVQVQDLTKEIKFENIVNEYQEFDGTPIPIVDKVLKLPNYSSGGGSGGDVYKVGTPESSQIPIWTGDGTIKGDSNFTYDGFSGFAAQLTLGSEINNRFGWLRLYGGYSGAAIIDFYANQSQSLNVYKWRIGTSSYVGSSDFFIGSENGPINSSLLFDSATLAMSAPATSIADINTLGAKALITKEYLDSTVSGGGGGSSGDLQATTDLGNATTNNMIVNNAGITGRVTVNNTLMAGSYSALGTESKSGVSGSIYLGNATGFSVELTGPASPTKNSQIKLPNEGGNIPLAINTQTADSSGNIDFLTPSLTGTSLKLSDNLAGIIYNSVTPSTANNFTTTDLKRGGHALNFISTAGKVGFPTLNATTTGLRSGAPFEANATYQMIVTTYNGTDAIYYFRKYSTGITDTSLEYGITGALNGTNKIFTVDYKYVPGSIKVFVSGVILFKGDDFTESGSKEITFQVAPLNGEKIIVEYIKQ